MNENNRCETANWIFYSSPEHQQAGTGAKLGCGKIYFVFRDDKIPMSSEINLPAVETN